ncbi:hypothetical protein GQ44DRAFT_696410 [Phaeosphaeriaceae sp. PMI808]|nr:hypothetical protein GQ44DRAFT_696410 [Phaeosphaeriaceae sp. PMI808]
MTRRASGVGINIPWANVVILCAPWWKAEWEENAFKRVWRPGQERSVNVYSLIATNCHAEVYKARQRDRKHRFNGAAMKQVTSGVGDEVRTWTFGNHI